tara:strand:+ start:1942 stop:2154 length:213 start_codon:yes stop_codon:yes gene_type:complete
MNKQLLEAATDLLRWVLIKNEGMVPLDLLDAQYTIKEEQRAQTLEDIHHSERARYNESLLTQLYGDERHE